MDFLTTARLLMDMQEQHNARYNFENTWDGKEVVIRIPVDLDVPKMFTDARRMFEPAD